MCDYCGPEEARRAAARADMDRAKKYEEIARFYREVASGFIKPHTEAFKLSVPTCLRALIHELIDLYH